MHVHIQNRSRNAFPPLTQEVVSKAISGRVCDRFTLSDSNSGFADAIATAEVLVTTANELQLRFPCPAPRLKAIFLTHAGLDELAARNPLPPDILVMNNSGAHARKAGEYVLMATLMSCSGMPGFIANQRDRLWLPTFSPTLAGRRITVIGVGRIGTAVAKVLRPFGVHLTGIRNGNQPHPDFDATAPTAQLDAVLPQTDVLVLAAPLTPATRGLIDARQLQRLPRSATLINIGRGELLDQPALLAALQSENIAGAVLDVFEAEPLPADDPVWATPNLIVTPHVSSTDSHAYGTETMRVLLENLDALVVGEIPPNYVDLSRGY